MSHKITYKFKADKELIRESEKLCQDLGLDLPTVLNMFLIRMVQSDGIPFKVEGNKLSKETVKLINDFRKNEEGRK